LTRRAVIAIHGGAGTIRGSEMTAKRLSGYRATLKRALHAGYEVLRHGGSSLDAVIASVVIMEDSPLFNAGRGATYNAEARHELDAAVMEGATLRAGAVAAVSRVRNPVIAARAVMEHSRHVLLVGRGAERFARRQGLDLVPESYFHTRSRLAALHSEKRTSAEQHGTVGAVALDSSGDLAAATSTGGYTGKLPGRVGDSPIIGAGTYADNRGCAVSGTGLGEAFIRCVLAHDVSARMRYRRESLARAAEAALGNIAALGGDGGLVAVDRRGNIAMPFNSQGMYRACIDRTGRQRIAIYR
jgi:L-asparaginase / beta-aspartyl-peptidase